jgi:protein O-GlcNAc transferase
MRASREPPFAAGLLQHGILHAALGNLNRAAACFRRALEIRPNFPEAHNELGKVCRAKGFLAEAAACYRRAISCRRTFASAHRNLGAALIRQGNVAQAIASLRTAVSLDPKCGEALSLLEHASRQACAWGELETLSRRLIHMVRTASGCVNPFTFLCLDTTPKEQMLCAKHWAARKVAGARGQTQKPSFRFHQKKRITVGYLSADFQEHATMRLISEIFSLHDRARFRILGYSFGPDDRSSARRKVVRSLDGFVDIRDASHEDAASRIRRDGVGILVDLKGYTTHARPQIPALRPAPVQVSYLGYPGTLSMSAIDYAIVDQYVVPSGQPSYFSEKLVRLPNSYQANAAGRKVFSPRPTRQDCGLPETGFLFCCFNASYKITPRVFDIWMRLLQAVKGSTLWLLDSNVPATANLKREANARGIASRRLVFAPELANSRHLARLTLADLYLDTFPYNAHTLASDALWAGCPMVTCSGRTFASRVAGSLLYAVGQPMLACASLEEYERLALELARDAPRLRAIRRKIQSARRSAPLFDSQGFTRHLEAAFGTMWDIFRRGEPPRSFAVPPTG